MPVYQAKAKSGNKKPYLITVYKLLKIMQLELLALVIYIVVVVVDAKAVNENKPECRELK